MNEPVAGRRLAGVGGILVATIVAGALGYVITAVAARGLGAADYAAFSVFWGALYLFVGSLSGIQQEVSRASTPGAPGATGMTTVVRFAAAIAGLTAVVVLAVGAVLAPLAFGQLAWPVVFALAFGLAFNAAVVTYSGVTYGLAIWRVVIVVIVLDVVLRLATVVVALLLGAGVLGLVWASVIPYPLVLAYLVGILGRRHPVELDVGFRGLALNVSRTLGASVGMAVLISGFPLVIGLARGGETDAAVGVLVFALILTRAPIVVSVLGLQSYLVVYFRTRNGRRVPMVMAFVTAVGAVLALLAWLVGPPIIVAIAGDEFAVSGELLAGLVLASVPTAWLALSGAVVLSQSRHAVYAAGWSVAAAVGVVLMFVIPGDLAVRTVVALAVGPVVGFAVHAVGTILAQRRAVA